jgi:pyridoxamine 5'-phosphate oxidase
MTAHDEPRPQADTISGDDPIALFEAWFEEAKKAEPYNPDAVALATVDAAGLPDVRMVLCKGVDARGFVFYTNLESAKGRALEAHAQAALCFYWKALKRQVRVRGPVEPVSAEEADAYFATRPRDAQIGAWASRQSRPLDGRLALEKEVARYAAKYALGKVPRPPHWSGYRVKPLAIEFWRERLFRLHERLLFTRPSLDARAWAKTRLFP